MSMSSPRVDDPSLRALPLVGGIDQFGDSSDMATPAGARAARTFLNLLASAG